LRFRKNPNPVLKISNPVLKIPNPDLKIPKLVLKISTRSDGQILGGTDRGMCMAAPRRASHGSRLRPVPSFGELIEA
jgi:hypothetical protein